MLTSAHRTRLRAAGVGADGEDDVLGTADWQVVIDGLPAWWHDNANVLAVAPGAHLPEKVVASLGIYPVRDVLIVIASPLEWLTSLLVGGDGATVFVGEDCKLTAGEIYCGAASSVVLCGPLTATRSAIVDARNGGSIVAGPDQLWAADVYVATDDMHRLENRTTGERLNPFGAHIRLGSHVWLGRDAVVTGHAEIGEGSVVGMRSLVRGQKVPAHTVVAGWPARVVREDVTWSRDDVP